jgi:acyl-CoA dehydrogenase
MGRHADAAPEAAHGAHTLLRVPLDTPGLSIECNLPLTNHHAIDGHCELRLREVFVPASSLRGEEGAGIALAQARLGPGRCITACAASASASRPWNS